jgi:hypothetical protein
MRIVSQTYIEAVIMGVCIALTVWFARAWLVDAGLGLRLGVFVVSGGLLCLLQAWLGRRRG